MNQRAIMAKLRKRLATRTPEERAARAAFLARRIEMDQREIAVLKELECASSR